MSDQVTIYHNPRCSKSREALELLRDAGCEPTIILYLEQPPTAKRLKDLLAALELSPREIMRTKETRYKELGLADAALDDDALIDQIVANPILLERPIVIAGDRARLCRPPELVHELFDGSV